MQSEFVLSNLPVGTGAGIGAFIRTLYLTASERWAIIGLQVNDLNLFDHIGKADTTMVSDLVLLFTGYNYVIPSSFDLEGNKTILDPAGDGISSIDIKMYTLDTRRVYGVTVHIKDGQDVLSTDMFRELYVTDKTRTIKLAEPTHGLVITFYISRVCGVLRKSATQAIFNFSDDSPENSRFKYVVAVPATGKRNSRCWSTLETDTQTEAVTIHLEGELSFEDDLAELRRLVSEYSGYVIDCIQNE